MSNITDMPYKDKEKSRDYMRTYMRKYKKDNPDILRDNVRNTVQKKKLVATGGEMKYYELTDRPSLYKGSYWGNFSVVVDSVSFDEKGKSILNIIKEQLTTDLTDVIDSRNQLAIDYRLKKRIHADLIWIQNMIRSEEAALKQSANKVVWNCIDHLEMYRTRDDKMVAVISPYGVIDHKPYEDNGWTHVPNLYSKSATSFVKLYPFCRLKDAALINQPRAGLHETNQPHVQSEH